MEIITSNKNQRVKDIQRLNKEAAYRNKKGVFVIEGIRMFVELPVDRVNQVVLSESAWNKYSSYLSQMGFDDKDESLMVVKDSVYNTLSQTKTPQGLMAVINRKDASLSDILECKTEKPPIYLVVESLQDPGNMGTILRSSEAAGVTGVIIGGDSCDPYNPKVVRSTMGAIFRVPFVISKDLVSDINKLKAAGVAIYGAHLDGGPLYKEDLNKPVAFLIGNEGNGLTDEVAATANNLIRIPMEGQVESLNAAISATLLAYEAYRQRQ